ncbi:MAG: hypothetical protein ABNH03_00560 [Alteromonas sp.]|jgi:hypothetical protein|uniref:hypothetical protein n=1 Tax=Alteromonas sp. TaxID=232 RepID=UPI0032D8B9DD
MIKKTLLATSVLFSLNVFAGSDSTLKILNFEVDPAMILDSTGKLVEEIPVAQLPTPEIEVLAFNEELELVQINNRAGTPIWLDIYDLELNQGKIVELDCSKLATARQADHHETGTMGFGGRCSKD